MLNPLCVLPSSEAAADFCHSPGFFHDCFVRTGGPFDPVELGRLDSRMSTKDGVQHKLPDPSFNLDRPAQFHVASHGLTQTDMLALSGAHTIGFSHCAKFRKRIYEFRRAVPIDPTMNSSYAIQLRQACLHNDDPSVVVGMDPVTPFKFDNGCYQNLRLGMGLFTSDHLLFSDPRSRDTVDLFAANQTAFEEAFVVAITKLGRTTGPDGEIRHDCSVVN